MDLASDLIAGASAAGRYVGLSARVIYHLVEVGELPAIKKAGRLYFRKSELEAAFSTAGKAA